MSKTMAAALGALLALGSQALGCNAGVEPAATSASAGSVAEALQEKDPIARVGRLAAALQALGPQAAVEAQEILAEPQFDYGVGELELLVRVWAKSDAPAATDWALRAAPEGCPLSTIVPAIEEWALQDPRAAAEAVRKATRVRGPTSTPAELALVRGWFASGEPGVDEFIRDMGIGFERQRALSTLCSKMIERDGPESVQRWAEGIPDDDPRFKLAAFRQVGSELAKVDVEAAIAWCDEHCDGPYGSNVRTQIAIRYVPSDPEAAMAWLASVPPGIERDYAVRGGYGAWLRRDRDAARDWVTEKGIDWVEPWFVPAVGRYAMARAMVDPEAAIEWAALIPDEEKRELAYITIFKHWRYRDEAEALAWLQESPLSEEAREKALVRDPLELPSQRPAPTPPE